MLIPVRCLSCGRPLSGLWDEYKNKVLAGGDPSKVLDELKITSYCCRSLFLTHKDVIQNIARFRI